MEYALNASAVTEVKRLIGLAAPHVKSSHRVEAMARGLGFTTNAALVHALADGATIRVTPDREAFEAFLAERGHRVSRLQTALLGDAVWLATGHTGQPPMRNPGGTRPDRCLLCQDVFMAAPRHNKMCPECKVRAGRLPGVHHANHLVGDFLDKVFFAGRLPRLCRQLRARPGWADLFDGAAFQAEVTKRLATRAAVFEGRLKDLPKAERKRYESMRHDDYMERFTKPSVADIAGEIIADLYLDFADDPGMDLETRIAAEIPGRLAEAAAIVGERDPDTLTEVDPLFQALKVVAEDLLRRTVRTLLAQDSRFQREKTDSHFGDGETVRKIIASNASGVCVSVGGFKSLTFTTQETVSGYPLETIAFDSEAEARSLITQMCSVDEMGEITFTPIDVEPGVRVLALAELRKAGLGYLIGQGSAPSMDMR